MADVAANDAPAPQTIERPSGLTMAGRDAVAETIGVIEGRRLNVARLDAQPETVGLIEGRRLTVSRRDAQPETIGLLERARVTLVDTTPPAKIAPLILLSRQWA
jgi:hypothetical protein